MSLLKPPPSHACPHAPAPTGTGAAAEDAGVDAGAPRWLSHQLLGGQREAHIDHEGTTYRLRLTSLGKLILTK